MSLLEFFAGHPLWHASVIELNRDGSCMLRHESGAKLYLKDAWAESNFVDYPWRDSRGRIDYNPDFGDDEYIEEGEEAWFFEDEEDEETEELGEV